MEFEIQKRVFAESLDRKPERKWRATNRRILW